MALDFKTPSTVAQEYRTYLKNLKPDVNVEQTDSDWWVKSRVFGGVMSGVYADQKKVASDFFPQSARRDALVKMLETYGMGSPIEAQQAAGTVAVSGDIGTFYAAGTLFQYDPNGNTYSVDDDTTLAATAGEVLVTSVNAGQDQNLLTGSDLSMPSPPAGHSAATVVVMGDGRDDETDEEIAARVLARIQQPIQGGTESDYEQWAVEADGSVTSANVVRYPFGLGTVAVYITAGTTDIDTAIDNDQAIVRTPSDQLLEEVLAYIYERKPVTDCASVFGAIEVGQNVTVKVHYTSGSGSTIPAGQTLTQEELVVREVRRALYKIPTGGRDLGASGYVLASELEEALDSRLSSSPYAEGSDFQILNDRQVEDLTATGANRLLLDNEIVIPGTITVVEV